MADIYVKTDHDRTTLLVTGLDLVVKQVASIASPVKYANIWIDGHCTHLRNGDRFFYFSEDDVPKFNMFIMVQDMKAQVFKPVIYSRCSRCDGRGIMSPVRTAQP